MDDGGLFGLYLRQAGGAESAVDSGHVPQYGEEGVSREGCDGAF
jgi:hypothetical protein